MHAASRGHYRRDRATRVRRRSFMSTTASPAVAVDYSGGEETPGSILIMDFEMGSRGASVQWCSQYPHEAELLFPPLTTLSTRRVTSRGAKRLVLCSVDVSTAVPDTGDILVPNDVPGGVTAKGWLCAKLKCTTLDTVRDCDLSDTTCHGAGATHLALLLGRCSYAATQIRTLNLHQSQLDDHDIGVLAPGLALNDKLEELKLSGNSKLTERSGEPLAEAIRANRTLRRLDLFGTSLAAPTLQGVGLLANALGDALQRRTSALEAITLHSCSLPVRCLSGADAVSEIDLSSQSLVAADGILIATLLKSNSVLRSLRLADNRLADAAQEFVQVLATGAAPQLRELHLEANSIGEKVKIALKQAAARRTHNLVLAV